MLDLILGEIQAGLHNETRRLDQSKKNIDFYRGDFDQYLTYPEDGDYETPEHPRPTLIMQRVVTVLAQHLYAKGPARELPAAPEVSAWLATQYQREGVDGKLQEADRLALAGDVCGVQVVGPNDDEDPVEAAERPVRFQLWPADQLIVWTSPSDPTRPWAVATIDRFDNCKRLTLWTRDLRTTFETDKLSPGQTSGGTAYHRVDEVENYYGSIPFAFVHANPPATEFWNHGPGDVLSALNDYLNHDFTELGESLRYARQPIITEFGNDSNPPKPIRPGSRWKLNAAAIDTASNGIPPEVGYLQPDLGFVDTSWSDAQSMIDHTLQMVNCPPAAIRMVADTAKSGAAIVVEQIPLITWATGRQRAFDTFERDLMRVVIVVALAELLRLKVGIPTGLTPALAHDLTLRWPSMTPEVPMTGAEQAAQDAADLAIGIVSRIKIVMRRMNLTREQAVDYLKSITDDLAEETLLGLPPIPTPQALNANAQKESATSARDDQSAESVPTRDDG